MEQARELPMLAGIGAALRWCEELLVLASGPILTFGLGVGLIALLTDGQLLASAPWLILLWGIAMAAGVDGQLIGSAVKCGRAVRSQQWWHVLGYLILIAALGYVAYLAAIVFAVQQAEGISTAQALSRLGMDNTTWITQRSGVAVVLVILSGVLRYDPAKKVEETAPERTEREARELANARHKAELRAVKAAGMRQVGAAALGKVNPLETPDDGTPGAPVSDGAIHLHSDADSSRIDIVRRRINPGTKAVPSDMMSTAQFRAYLAENDVHIPQDKAVGIVQSARGCTQVGKTFAAPRRALIPVAMRMIERARSTGNAGDQAQEVGA